MLKEVTGVPIKAVPGASRRRWFQDEELDLLVWYDAAGESLGFQLCYGRGHDEHAVTWRRDSGIVYHDRVDSGEDAPEVNATPILVADGVVDWSGLARSFRERSGELDPEVGRLVLARLETSARDLS